MVLSDVWSTAVGVATFAWFALQVEMAHQSEMKPSTEKGSPGVGSHLATDSAPSAKRAAPAGGEVPVVPAAFEATHVDLSEMGKNNRD